jgi:hypothetical protein
MLAAMNPVEEPEPQISKTFSLSIKTFLVHKNSPGINAQYSLWDNSGQSLLVQIKTFIGIALIFLLVENLSIK